MDWRDGTLVVQPGERSPLEFGYDAAAASFKRRPSTGRLLSEDRELPPSDRRNLISQTRDCHRNFALAAWMLRRHLDYVSTFSFQAKTSDPELNRRIEQLMREWSLPENCDAARRHAFPDMVRLVEQRAVLDGDCALYLLRDGRVQAIEGDRIRTPIGGAPEGVDPARLVHGVELNEVGAAVRYCVCRRGSSGDHGSSGREFEFERMIPARLVYLHGYFDRFDQVRGVSPLAPAINSLVDLYESLDYAIAKMKVSQLFALTFYRGDPASITRENVYLSESQDYTKLKLGKQPAILDLDPGDRAEFLESKTPSTEFQGFTERMIQLVLKALDIPYSFYAENYSTYSGSRQALLQYEQSANVKRERLRHLLDFITRWRLQLWMASGELPAIAPDEQRWEWVGAGLPWIDPLNEVKGDLAALSGGLTSRQRILRARGADFEEVAEELARENEVLAGLGVARAATIGEDDDDGEDK